MAPFLASLFSICTFSLDNIIVSQSLKYDLTSDCSQVSPSTLGLSPGFRFKYSVLHWMFPL